MDREHIVTLLPEVEKIKDASLRKGVVDTWLLAIEQGGWNRIEGVPFTLLCETKITLIEHTRCVTRMAMAIAAALQGLDQDTVIAAGLVHDVGKLLEYTERSGKVVKSRHGELVRHPVSGYGLARQAGLPLEVCHIIAAHSTEGECVKRSKEAIVIHHCDFIHFEVEKAG